MLELGADLGSSDRHTCPIHDEAGQPDAGDRRTRDPRSFRYADRRTTTTLVSHRADRARRMPSRRKENRNDHQDRRNAGHGEDHRAATGRG
ncbi:MAG TPA: hypothetical protein VH165_03630 [Kofleriaceae bacterium]|nr:hypothetical protein [Kofleriaceae bacterium]